VQKLEYSSDVLDAMNALKAAGAVPKWGCESPESGSAGTTRQNKFNGELKMAGIKVNGEGGFLHMMQHWQFLHTAPANSMQLQE
jgi:hypothetical protein